MKKEKQEEQWLEMLRTKVAEYEGDVSPEDWASIADRLPVGAKVELQASKRWYYAAAAVAALILISIGGLYTFRHQEPSLLSDEIPREQRVAPSREKPFQKEERVDPLDVSTSAMAVLAIEPDIESSRHAVSLPATVSEEALVLSMLDAASPRLLCQSAHVKSDDELERMAEELQERLYPERAQHVPMSETLLLADAVSASKQASTKRRWRIGVGGGGYGLQQGGGVFQESMFSSDPTVFTHRDQDHSPTEHAKLTYVGLKKHKLKHYSPLSFGLGFSYSLNERWSLQSGINYSFLKSAWETENWYSVQVVQDLHFIGVPLSINYKIAEWNRILFYLSTGGAVEWNVAGRLKSDKYEYPFDKVMLSKNEPLRMTQLQWSVNSRAGVSYPLFRFMNAFVEGGAYYYLNNGSYIETIRTEKPFRLSLHGGMRFGF